MAHYTGTQKIVEHDYSDSLMDLEDTSGLNSQGLSRQLAAQALKAWQ